MEERRELIKRDPWLAPEPSFLASAILFLIPAGITGALYLRGSLDKLIGSLGHPLIALGMAISIPFIATALFWALALRWPRRTAALVAVAYGIFFASIFTNPAYDSIWAFLAIGILGALLVNWVTKRIISDNVHVVTYSRGVRLGSHQIF